MMMMKMNKKYKYYRLATAYDWKGAMVRLPPSLPWICQCCERLYTVSQKNIPNIFECNVKTNHQILIIFGTNIPDTTWHKIIIQFSTSPNVCFCTTWGKHNQ